MKKFFILFFSMILTTEVSASFKKNIILNLKSIENLNFNFEQNINGKIEDGNCTIEYPKKIFCRYNQDDKKVLISNGRSLVIKTLDNYYLYPLEKTSLNLILDKQFLLDKIKKIEERIINNKFINFKFFENENEINLFFDKDTFNLIGWQTQDIYQNLSITYLSYIKKNIKIKKNLFRLPKKDNLN
tara:strand:- start:265 stop:822 length:558 start_codon:yes stop_codon:yes gene_type:complete